MDCARKLQTAALRALACAGLVCCVLPAVAQNGPQAAAAGTQAASQDKPQDASKDAGKDAAKDKPKPEAKKDEPPAVTEAIIPMQDAPKTYRAVYTDARFGPAFTVTVERDGERALVDRAMPGGAHTRTLYDLAQGTRVSWTQPNPAGSCVRAAFAGDWGDPFASTVFNGMDTHFAGNAVLRGVNTNIMEGPAASGGTARAWFDANTNLLLRAVETGAGGGASTLVELTTLDRATPPAAAFAVPAACAAPASAEALRARLFSGRAAEFTPANVAPENPGSESCTVLVRVVLAGSLAPLTRGFQAAVDLGLDTAHPPAYDIEVTPEGHATFAGGQLHEVTGEFRSGTLRLEHAPAEFEVDAEFGAAGSAHALVRRQCPAPETTLLLVVRDPAAPEDGAAWVWARHGAARP
jgi:hypothetical protein